MKVSSTELQNNFGKYLLLCIGEPVIISKNGREIAKLTSLEARGEYDSEKSIISEEAFNYGFGVKKASYKEFQELTRDNEERYEYIDGEIYYLASPKTTHQIVLTELFVIFHHWFQGKKCTPMVAPYDITLKRHPEDINIVQPDIMVICDLDEKLNQQDYYMGTPALVVEIISESTKRKDLIKKLDLYMS
ncbi:MAG: type II toxin-antitoxin system Phd/YefM family antitoxin, partial [Ruminiclostridium sp.]|nr:type II toxin-antitoxin system Phd/YefM family antitoxin [Ruminiclostridium sp.]